MRTFTATAHAVSIFSLGSGCDFLSDAPFENLVQNAQTYLLLYACAEGVVADRLGGRGVGLESYACARYYTWKVLKYESSAMERRAKRMFCLLVVIALLLEPLCFSEQSGEKLNLPDPGVIFEIERSICCVILDLSSCLHVFLTFVLLFAIRLLCVQWER